MLRVEAELDFEALKKSIESAPDIDKAQDFFAQLTEVQRAKNELQDILDRLKTIEVLAKSMFNDKAKVLYGKDWQTIEGDTFKATRTRTGAVYSIAGEPDDDFLITKQAVNSDAVKEYIKLNDGKLPKGLEYNDKRGESLRIRVTNENG